MVFNSLDFVVFFIVVTSAYFVLPHRYRNVLLLAASCYFYMAFVPAYILILGFTILIDYFAGILIEKASRGRRRMFLIVSLISNIGVLAVFKYYNFLFNNLDTILNSFGLQNHLPALSIILPVGLSFHTFQAMSYTIEVFRGKQKAERNFLIYALYVMFYPQLVAGPIERPQNLLHQFHEKHSFDYARIVDGLKLMLFGFFKKIVIADRLAIYVDTVYNNQSHHNGSTLIVATIFFAFQIYCDFSGYSDIAIGAARIMGFRLMSNFNHPYFSLSIHEFWKRWHISLSTWFKDYLYIPLGGNRVTVPRMYFNLLFVFLVSGLWHGASWTFVLWGGVNGLFLISGLFLRPLTGKLNRLTGLQKLPRISRMLKLIFTFALTCFAWIFFRANSTGDAFEIIKKIFRPEGSVFYPNPSLMLYSTLSIFFLVLFELKKEYFPGRFILLNHRSPAVRMASYSALIIAILLIGRLNGAQFIYFQF